MTATTPLTPTALLASVLANHPEAIDAAATAWLVKGQRETTPDLPLVHASIDDLPQVSRDGFTVQARWVLEAGLSALAEDIVAAVRAEQAEQIATLQAKVDTQREQMRAAHDTLTHMAAPLALASLGTLASAVHHAQAWAAHLEAERDAARAELAAHQAR